MTIRKSFTFIAQLILVPAIWLTIIYAAAFLEQIMAGVPQ